MLWIFAIAVLGALVFIAALPLWFPWVLRPAAKRFGANYANYERLGYQRFTLTDVEFTNSSGRFLASKAEAFVPTVWLWRCLVGPKTTAFLHADSWSWNASTNAAKRKISSAYDTLQTDTHEIGVLEKFLPKAELTHGTLRLDGQIVQIPEAIWDGGKLSAQLASPRLKQILICWWLSNRFRLPN